MLDQITPVEICTEATLPSAMLSSLLPKQAGFHPAHMLRSDDDADGKEQIALVQRLAVKVSGSGIGVQATSSEPKHCGARSAGQMRTSAPT
jgi:hypothetical protein